MEQPLLCPMPNENRYMLKEEFGASINGSNILVPRFFVYDGASIPPAAWQLTYTPFHPDVMAASLIHDWLYYNHQVNQETADDIFYELLRSNGVNFLLAKTMWIAVRSAGSLYWDNNKDERKFLLELYSKVKGDENIAKYHFPSDIIGVPKTLRNK